MFMSIFNKIMCCFIIVAISAFSYKNTNLENKKNTSSLIAFSQGEIEKALREISNSTKADISFEVDTLLGKQAYKIERNLNKITISGGDELGLMYGGIELAELIKIGTQAQAYNLTQCLDTATVKWSQLTTLNTGRHGSGAVVYDNKVYIAAGSPVKGGGELKSMEVFSANHKWQSLFNGKNLDGWDIKCVAAERDKKFWYVENGLLVCNSMGSKDHSYIWLQSQKEYDDFELRFKFQSTRENIGNSGIQIRSRWSDEPLVSDVNTQPGWMDGPQIDIDPNNNWRNGFIYDETTEVRHWINPVLPDWKIDKEKYAPKKVIHYFENEQQGWNDMTIICNGTKIQTYVNNILVSDYDGTGILNDEIHKKYNVGMKGHLAFQLHMKGENHLRFKDVEIRELNK